jgi:chemotaxis signal transduction protein
MGSDFFNREKTRINAKRIRYLSFRGIHTLFLFREVSRISRFSWDQIFQPRKNANQREMNLVFEFPRDPHFISASRGFARFAVPIGSDLPNREKTRINAKRIWYLCFRGIHTLFLLREVSRVSRFPLDQIFPTAKKRESTRKESGI